MADHKFHTANKATEPARVSAPARLLFALFFSAAMHVVLVCLPIRDERATFFIESRRLSTLRVTLLSSSVNFRSPSVREASFNNFRSDAVFPYQGGPRTPGIDENLAIPGGRLRNGSLFYPAEILPQRPTAEFIGEFESPITRQMVVSGALILQIWVDKAGTVVDVVVEESGLPHKFVEAARNAFLAARFSPGVKDGLAVGSIVRVEVRYDDDRLRPPEEGSRQNE